MKLVAMSSLKAGERQEEQLFSACWGFFISPTGVLIPASETATNINTFSKGSCFFRYLLFLAALAEAHDSYIQANC